MTPYEHLKRIADVCTIDRPWAGKVVHRCGRAVAMCGFAVRWEAHDGVGLDECDVLPDGVGKLMREAEGLEFEPLQVTEREGDADAACPSCKGGKDLCCKSCGGSGTCHLCSCEASHDCGQCDGNGDIDRCHKCHGIGTASGYVKIRGFWFDSRYFDMAVAGVDASAIECSTDAWNGGTTRLPALHLRWVGGGAAVMPTLRL